MVTSIATKAPTFHAITGTQAIGHTQISVRGDYANTVTTVKRMNTDYYLVTVRQAKNAFAAWPAVAVTRSARVWKDTDGSYVADYWDTARCDQPIEAARSWDLRAALAVAIGSAAERGHQDGLW